MGLLAGLAIQTGRLEKANPLPVGAYWLDVFAPELPVWNAWVKGAGAAVHIVSTEVYEADEANGYPARTWIRFDALSPVAWNRDADPSKPKLAIDIGWPNTDKVPPKTSDDTVDKPKTPGPLEGPFGGLGDDKPDEWSWVKWVIGGGVVVAGIYSIAKLVRG